MNITFNNSTIDKYFGFLKKLDNRSKKRLIEKLSNSIQVEEKNKIDLSTLYGAWEDTRSSDDIIKDLKSARVDKKNNVSL